MLATKKILLGVCGGIASYKAVEIVSRLRKSGADVKVIMTAAATKFVTPLTFREMSANPVVSDMWSEITHYSVEHIALAAWADIVLIAPATANIIAKLTHGIADDMLSTTLLATKAPVILCPAMNSNMYEHPVTQANLTAARNLGIHIIEPESGQLACGVIGKGRLPEPADIVENIRLLCANSQSMHGLKVVVTAAGTREAIDPVRYIGNRSSGKMGYAIAEEAARRGAEVVLISGPANLTPPARALFVSVETTAQMRDAVLSQYDNADIVIKAAAVSDYRVKAVANQKIKKSSDSFTLELIKNPDILQELGKLKKRQYLVGFAAETNDLINNAVKKIADKNLDMIVANDVSLPGAGFNYDTNIVKFIYPDGRIINLQQLHKTDVAKKLLDDILSKFNK